MNFSGILIGVLTFFLIGLFHPYLYICGVLLWKPLLAGILLVGILCMILSVRMQEILVGFLGVLGVGCLLWALGTERTGKKRKKDGSLKPEGDKH